MLSRIHWLEPHRKYPFLQAPLQGCEMWVQLFPHSWYWDGSCQRQKININWHLTLALPANVKDLITQRCWAWAPYRIMTFLKENVWVVSLVAVFFKHGFICWPSDSTQRNLCILKVRETKDMVMKSEDLERGHIDKKFGGQYENRSRGPEDQWTCGHEILKTEDRENGKNGSCFEKSRTQGKIPYWMVWGQIDQRIRYQGF